MGVAGHPKGVRHVRRFRRHGQGDDLDARVRAARPTPRPDFLSSLVERVRVDRTQRPAPLLVRFAYSVGLTATLAAALAVAGGFDYAASGAAQAVDAVQAAASSGTETEQQSPGQQQY